MKFTTLSAIAISTIAIASPAHAASIVADPVFFSTTDDEAALQALGVPSITFGSTTIYIGSRQVAADNQDPILTSFTNGTRDWLVTDYETTGTDARGVGLLWDGGSNLYAAFTTDGTQGTPDEDFRRFTENGWLPTYGAGGGATVSVLLKIDPLTGQGLSGTFITSLLADMTSNTVMPTGLDFSNGNVVFYGDSYHAPRNVDGEMQEQTTPADPPFPYTVVFDPTLETALCAEAPGWDGLPLNSEGTCLSNDDDPMTSVPEPGTIVGLSLFGLGWLLSRRSRTV